MRIFLAHTGKPNELTNSFNKDILSFLYVQEDRTEYKIKTISYLIDEIQKMPSGMTGKELYISLSKKGKRRFNTILNQLNYLVENG